MATSLTETQTNWHLVVIVVETAAVTKPRGVYQQ